MAVGGGCPLCQAGVRASLHFHELTSAQHHEVHLGNKQLKCWEGGGAYVGSLSREIESLSKEIIFSLREGV